MARKSTLIDILNDFRAECRLSLNAAQNNQDRQRQVILLQRKQEWLWRDFDWPHLRVDRFIELQAGQRYYAPPSDIDIDRIQTISVQFDSAFVPLPAGIGDAEYTIYNSDLDDRTWPVQRWKLTEDEQIEVWPIPNSNYSPTTLDGRLRVTGIKRLAPFVADTDRADLDDRLITMHAAAEYLAQAGSQDAQLKLDQATTLYAKLRGQLMPRRKYGNMFGAKTTGQRVVRVPIAVYNKD